VRLVDGRALKPILIGARYSTLGLHPAVAAQRVYLAHFDPGTRRWIKATTAVAPKARAVGLQQEESRTIWAVLMRVGKT
jgi:hypothetical protein